MPRLALAALLLAGLAFASPAVAMQFDFAKDGMLSDIENTWPSDYAQPRKSLRIGTVTTMDGLSVQYETTPLADLAARYGGAIQRFANAGYDTQWLCYTAAGSRIWYITGGAPEEMNGGLTSWVLLEETDGSHDADYGCVEEPKAMLAADPRVPILGMSLADVEALYDVELPSGERYVTMFEDADEEPVIVTNITLRVENDRVTGISLVEGVPY